MEPGRFLCRQLGHLVRSFVIEKMEPAVFHPLFALRSPLNVYAQARSERKCECPFIKASRVDEIEGGSPVSCSSTTMASNGTLVLPNPNTPLAFLEPTLANQFEVSRYLYVAGLSVSRTAGSLLSKHQIDRPLLQAFVWDWLMSIPEECKIFRGSKLSVPNVAYFLSRSVKSCSTL